MLQSIKRAFRIDPNNPKLHSCLIRYHQYIEKVKDLIDPAIQEVITKEVQIMFNGKTAVELNSNYLDTHRNCLTALLDGAKMLYFLNPSNQEKALNIVTALGDNIQNINLKVSKISNYHLFFFLRCICFF